MTRSFEAVIARLVRAQIVNTFTTMPGRIESYDRVTQSCSVKPMIARGVKVENGKRVVEYLGVIENAPVIWPGRMTHELQRGDVVLIAWSMRNLDLWLVRDGLIDPEDDRTHDKNDAIVIPDMHSLRNPLPPEAVHETEAVAYAPDGLRLGGSDVDEDLDRVIRKRDLIAFMQIAVTVTDSVGAIAALVTALGWTPLVPTPPVTPGAWPDPQSTVKSK